jgi:hypothetical protein
MSVINGTPGNDTLTGTSDSDFFNGLSGFDTAQFAMGSGEATFGLNAQGRWTVQWPAASRQGTDTLDSVEAAKFSDGLVAFGQQEFRVNSSTALDQTQPVLTRLSDGSLVATWVTAAVVRAQHFDAAGAAIGGEITAPSLGPQPSVPQHHGTAATADGGYLVAAVTGDMNYSVPGYPVAPVIAVSRFSGDGHWLGAVGLDQGARYQSGTIDVSSPTIAGLSDGHFLVTWTYSWANARGGGSSLKAQILDSSGAAVGSLVVLPAPSGELAPLPDGGFALASGGSDGITVRRFDSTLTLVGTSQVGTGTVTSAPGIASLSDGGSVVTWTVPAAAGFDLYAQRMDSAGVAIDSASRVNLAAASVAGQPIVTALRGDGYVVAWTSQQPGASGTDIHAQRFDGAGTRVGGEVAVNTALGSIEQQPTVTALDDGGFMVGWMSSSAASDGWDIHAQRFDSTGAAVPSGHALDGDASANTLQFSGSAPVHLLGEGGDDVLQAGSGSDWVDGGPGWDTVVSPDPHSAITWSVTGDRVLRMTGPEGGSDALQAVEQVRADGAAIDVQFDGTTQLRLVQPRAAAQYLTNPDVAVLRDGSFIGTYAAADGTYAQRFDESGTAVGSPARVDGGPATVAALADGGYVIAWAFTQPSAEVSAGTKVQRFDASGTAVGPALVANSHDAGSNTGPPAIAALAGGGYAVTWSIAHYPDGYGVFTREFDAGGEPLGPERQVNTTPGPFPGEQSIAALADGGFVITWTMGDPATWPNDPGYDIYAQRFDSAGLARDGEMRVNESTAGHQIHSAVTALADGGYVVTWMQYGGTGIVAQRFDRDGDRFGGERVVNPSAPHSDGLAPAVSALADGGYVVAWTASDGSGSGITAQRFDANDGRIGAEFRVNTAIAGEQTQPVITALGDGGYLVTWVSNQASGHAIDSQRFDANNLREGHLTLTGGAEDNVLRVTSAPEGVELIGGGGRDVLAGAGGWDVLTGGPGADTFEFAAAGNGVDSITDWTPGDRISIAGASFGDVVSAGNGASVALNAIESSVSGGNTVLHVGTDATPGADVEIRLKGSFAPGDFSVHDNVIEFAGTAPDIAPAVLDFFPAPGSQMLPADWNLGLTFSEPVKAGSGTITLQTAAGQVVQTFSATDPRVQFTGASVIIDPAGDLQPGTTYRLVVAPGAVQDLAGNAYPGESDYTFTTAGAAPPPGDSTIPVAVDFFPGSQTLPPDWSLGITFNESVRAGTGTITLLTTTGEVVQVFSVGSDPGIHIAGATVLIDPVADLQPGTTYRLIVGPDAIQDMAGNSYAGASDWSFTTAGQAPAPQDVTAPLAIDFFPAPGSQTLPPEWSLGITFSEPVRAGSGAITLQTAAGAVVQTFSATDPGIHFVGASVVIDPAADLQPGTTYRLVVAPDAIEDLVGNAYAGQSDFSFTVATSSQATLVGVPAEGAA